MRHDWTLLCSDIGYPRSGGIDLKSVISAMRVSDALRTVTSDSILSLDVPVWLVSQWSAEFDADKKVHPGVMQLLAPGGDRVLREDALKFDLQDTIVYRMIHPVPDLRYVGTGTYEFHVVLPEFVPIGEWGRACLRIN